MTFKPATKTLIGDQNSSLPIAVEVERLRDRPQAKLVYLLGAPRCAQAPNCRLGNAETLTPPAEKLGT